MNSFLVIVYNTNFIACQPSSSQWVDYPTMDFILPKSNFEVMIHLKESIVFQHLKCDKQKQKQYSFLARTWKF